jgi:hypothetical protein
MKARKRKRNEGKEKTKQRPFTVSIASFVSF